MPSHIATSRLSQLDASVLSAGGKVGSVDMRHPDARTDLRLSELSVGGRHRNMPDVHVDDSIQEDSREFAESQMPSPRFDHNDSLPLI